MKDPRPNLFMVTALILALAALLAGPVQAKVVDTDGTTTASSAQSTQQPFDGGMRALQIPNVIPYLSHGMGLGSDAGVSAVQTPKIVPYLSHGMGLGSDTGVSAARAEQTIPYLSHGFGVERGMNTRLGYQDPPRATATSGDGFGWRDGGLAASAGTLLIALLAATALVTTRHRSRTALP